MKQTNKLIKRIALILSVICVIFSGCATKISTSMDRPAELDLGTAKRISVLPFLVDENAYRSDISHRRLTLKNILLDLARDDNAKAKKDQNYVADFFKTELTSKLRNSNYYEFVDSPKVVEALQNNRELPVDVYVTGEIERYRVEINSERNSRTETDASGKSKTVYYDEYQKEVSILIRYDIYSAQTDTILYSESTEISRTSGREQAKRNLPKDLDVVRYALQGLAVTIQHKLEPYKVYMEMELLKDKAKDMKEAEKFAKNNLLDIALERYLEIYKFSKKYTAGYNAALILFAKHQLTDAKELAEQVSKTTSDPAVYKLLNKINNEIDYSKKLKEQMQIREELSDAK